MRDIYQKNKFPFQQNKIGVTKKLSNMEDFGEQKNVTESQLKSAGYGWRDLVVVGLYIVLIVLVTWPLIANIGSMIPGVQGDGGDSWHFVWNMWWMKQVIENHRDLFFTEYLYYPNGVSLVYHTLTIASGLIVYVVTKWMSLIVAFNALYLFYIFLAAVFSYELARRLWGSRKGAFLTGIIYAFSPYFFAHSLGHFNLTVLWPFPLMGILLLQLYNKFSWSGSIGLGVLLAFVFLTDLQYFVMAVLFLLIFVVIRLWYWQGERKNWWWAQFGLSAIVCLLLVYPVLSKSLMVAQNYLPSALLSEINTWSADLMAFFTPSFQNPFWGDLSQKYFGLYNFGGVESVVYIGWLVFGLALISLFMTDLKYKWQKIWWWCVLLVFFIFSLGPFLKIAGISEFQISDVHFSIPLPYMIFYKIPFLSVVRVPARFFVIMSLASGVLVAYSLMQIEKRVLKYANGLTRPAMVLLAVVLGMLILIDYSSWPMSLQSTSIPKVYDAIKADAGNFVILEMPLWWTSGHRSQGDVETKIQYYQTYHEKKILNGSVSRVPNALFDYYQKLPGVKYLINVEQNVADEMDLNKEIVLKEMTDDLDVKYVIIHKKYFSISDYFLLRNYFENILGQEIWYEDDGELAYKLQ